MLILRCSCYGVFWKQKTFDVLILLDSTAFAETQAISARLWAMPYPFWELISLDRKDAAAVFASACFMLLSGTQCKAVSLNSSLSSNQFVAISVSTWRLSFFVLDLLNNCPYTALLMSTRTVCRLFRKFTGLLKVVGAADSRNSSSLPYRNWTAEWGFLRRSAALSSHQYCISLLHMDYSNAFVVKFQ